jgi:hypothetical protein
MEHVENIKHEQTRSDIVDRGDSQCLVIGSYLSRFIQLTRYFGFSGLGLITMPLGVEAFEAKTDVAAHGPRNLNQTKTYSTPHQQYKILRSHINTLNRARDLVQD